MTYETDVYASGAWRPTTEISVRVGTSWKEVQEGYVYAAGAWKQIFNYDLTGPTAPTGVSATWGINVFTAPYCSLNWTQPTSPDLSYTRVEKALLYGEYSFLENVSGSGAKQILDYGVTLSPYTIHHPSNFASSAHVYRLTPYDTRGNAGTAAIVVSKGQGSAIERGFIQSPYYVNPSASADWQDGNGVWISDVVNQGYQTVFGNGRRFGHYFYDDRQQAGLNVTWSDIFLKRFSGAGINTGIPAMLHTSSAGAAFPFLGSNPVGAIQNAAHASGSFSFDTTAWANFPTSWGQNLMNGTSDSIVLDAEQTSDNTGQGYSSYYSNWAPYNYDLAFGVLFGGSLRLTHTG